MSYEFSESDIEEIIAKHPEIIEKGLTLKGRQVAFRGKRVDLLLTDKLGYALIVELKKGFVKREDVGQLVEYYGVVNASGQERVRVMLVGSVIPLNLQRGMDGHGIEYRELNDRDLIEFLKKNDSAHLGKIQRKQPPPPITPPRPVTKAPETIPYRLGEQRYWIFQTKPRRYRYLDSLREIGEDDDWTIARFADEIHKGDMVLTWLSGENAGGYAIAEITTNPDYMFQQKHTLKYWIKEEDRKEYAENRKLLVRIRYIKKLLDQPILRVNILDDSILRDLSIIKQPQGTNFRVTPRQWQRIMELAGLS